MHVVNCEEEFQQQQLDVLWRILDPGAHTALQVSESNLTLLSVAPSIHPLL